MHKRTERTISSRPIPSHTYTLFPKRTMDSRRHGFGAVLRPAPAHRIHSSDIIYRQNPRAFTSRQQYDRSNSYQKAARSPVPPHRMSDDESLTPTNGASQRVTPGQTAPTTPRITVDTEIKVDSKDAPGEPMVQDFADKYIPREFQPEHLQRSESPAPHVSSLQLSSDEESGAPAPPDLSRRGIHIPSRTRYATRQHCVWSVLNFLSQLFGNDANKSSPKKWFIRPYNARLPRKPLLRGLGDLV